MSGQGIAQILVYVVVLIALGYPLGIYMARVYTTTTSRGAAGSAGSVRSSAASTAPSASTAIASRTGRATGRSRSSSARSSRCSSTDAPASGTSVPEPGPSAGRAGAHRAEYDGQLHHEHELAVLRRRVHDVVPEPDGRARGAELRLRRGRAWRCSPRSCAESRGARATRSATSGATSTARSSTSCCRSRSSSA